MNSFEKGAFVATATIASVIGGAAIANACHADIESTCYEDGNNTLVIGFYGLNAGVPIESMSYTIDEVEASVAVPTDAGHVILDFSKVPGIYDVSTNISADYDHDGDFESDIKSQKVEIAACPTDDTSTTSTEAPTTTTEAPATTATTAAPTTTEAPATTETTEVTASSTSTTEAAKATTTTEIPKATSTTVGNTTPQLPEPGSTTTTDAPTSSEVATTTTEDAVTTTSLYNTLPTPGDSEGDTPDEDTPGKSIPKTGENTRKTLKGAVILAAFGALARRIARRPAKA